MVNNGLSQDDPFAFAVFGLEQNSVQKLTSNL